MNLKARMSARCFGLMLLAMASFGNALAENVKVNSRMSFYTQEKQAEILVYVPEGSGTATFNGKKYPLKPGVNLVPVEMQSLKMGDNPRSITVECQGESREYPVTLRRLKPTNNEVKIDYTTGGVLVNGLPYLPTGFYTRFENENYKMLIKEVTEGINLYSAYGNGMKENKENRFKYLDLCAQLGVKVNYHVTGMVPKGKITEKLKKSKEEMLEDLRQEILRVKDNPALLCYYIADEPDGGGGDPDIMKPSYDLIRELDPYHPVSIVIISPLPAKRFAKTYDILMADPYPIPNVPAKDAPRMIKDIYEQMRYEKAVWMAPQVFGGAQIWSREATSREVRAMCYGGILSGARALQGFRHMPGLGSPLLWSGFREVAVELQQLTPYLFDGNSVEVKTNQEQIMARAYRANGNMVIVAQNMENTPCILKADLPVDTDEKEVSQIFENRKIGIRNGVIEDLIPAFGTGVYKFPLERAASKIAAGNLLVNPSFEESAEAGEVTGGPGGADETGTGASLFPDTRTAYDGETSIRLTNPSVQAGAARKLFPIDNESDRTYIFSVWAKADKYALAQNRARSGAMTFKLSLDGLGEKTFELTGEWKRYELVCPPKDYVRVHHGGSAGAITLLGEGTAWFDLAQITPEIHIGTERTADRKGFVVTMENYLENGVIHYTTDGSTPTLSSPIYKEPFEVRSVQNITARVFVGKKGCNPESKVVAAHKALDAKVTYLQPYSPKYKASGDNAMTDGKFAPMNAQAPLWHGYFKNDMDLVVDLGQVEKINRVELGFMQSLTAWVMPPKTLEVLVSADGEKYKRAGIIRYGEARQGAGEYDYNRIPFVLKNLKKKARYVRVKAEHPQTLPSWHKVLGEAWMFIDEVIVE